MTAEKTICKMPNQIFFDGMFMNVSCIPLFAFRRTGLSNIQLQMRPSSYFPIKSGDFNSCLTDIGRKLLKNEKIISLDHE